MTQDEALRVLGLSQLPSSEEELDTAYTTITQRTQNELHCAANGAATEAVMNKLAQLQQAKLTLLPHVRGQDMSNMTQQPYHAPGPAPSPGPGSTPPPPPSPPSSPVPPVPPWNYSPPRRSVRLRFWQASWSTTRLLWRMLTWPFTAPWRAIRWVHTRLRSWRASRQAGPSAGARWKRRIVVAAMLAVVCAVAAFRHLPGGASAIFVTFPASDVFLDEAYITTAPSPEHFKVNWGWRKVTCVTPEGLAHRFHVLLLPGQTYRVKVNLQDDTHAVTRQSSSVATPQNAETE